MQQPTQPKLAVPPESLEANPEKGVHFLSDSGEGDAAQPYELSYAQFNPKHRVLVTGGDHYNASMYDLRTDNAKFGASSSLPHVSGQEKNMRNTADVSSVHWNQSGSHLVTSSSDKLARIWKFDEASGSI